MVAVQRCQSYLFFGFTSVVSLPARAEIGRDVHLLDPVRSPAQDAPRSFNSVVPAANLAPFAGLVMIERTGIDSRMRKFAGSALPPGTIGLIARAIGELRHAGPVMLAGRGW